jgi:hypothetical protein
MDNQKVMVINTSVAKLRYFGECVFNLDSWEWLAMLFLFGNDVQGWAGN